MFSVLKPKRTWFQYRLRTLLAFTSLCGVAAKWVGDPIIDARRQENAVQAIEASGGTCYHCRGKPLVPQWACGPLGLNFGISISHVQFRRTSGDAELALLDNLPNLLCLIHSGCGVTDAGLRHVAGLTELGSLNLSGTQVTDSGLRQLTRLTKLKYLDLSGTQVTGDGVKGLQRALPNCHIVVGPPDRQ